MIRIHIVRECNKLKQITLKGHANYSDYGNDIVCAAVSATYLCTVNGILAIVPTSIDVTTSNDTQIIDIISDNEVTEKLLYNMINCLKNLEQQYPNNIKIK